MIFASFDTLVESMEEMKYPYITERIIYVICYTFYSLDIIVLYQLQTLINRFSSIEPYFGGLNNFCVWTEII